MLTPFVPFDPTETLHSHASRLSLLHTGQPSSRLFGDLGISSAKFRVGDPDAIGMLALATGEDSDKLRNSAIRCLSRYNVFRCGDYSRSFLTSRVRQFCPQCLRADGDHQDWRFRLAWCFPAVSVCPIHEIRLSDIAGVGGDDARAAVVDAGGLDCAETATKPMRVHPTCLWLHGRIRGEEANSWLDDQSIEQVLASSEMLGLVLEHGEQIRPARLPGEIRETAAVIGFEIFRSGPDAIFGALDDIRRRSAASAVQAGPLAVYGVLYDWLDRRAQLVSPGPIKDIVRRHILENSAYGAGERLLGEVVSERRLHSVQSLAATLKIDRRRMSHLLQKIGLVPEGASDAESGRLVFPVQEVEQLVQDYEASVPLAEAPAYLGGSQRLTLSLYRSGLLPPVIHSEAAGSVRRVLFAKRVLDEILGQISMLPIAPPPLEADLVSVTEFCRRHGGKSEDLISAILSGERQGFRRPGEPHLNAILVAQAPVPELSGSLASAIVGSP